MGFFIGVQLLMMAKVIDWGSFVEWAAAFYIMFFFLSLYWDFKDLDMMMIRKWSMNDVMGMEGGGGGERNVFVGWMMWGGYDI